MRRRSVAEVVWTALVCGMLTACGSDGVKIRGHVTDGTGEQSQGLRVTASRRGGPRTVVMTEKVRASVLEKGGKVRVLAEADVDDDGSYSLELDQDYLRVILEAVSGRQQTLASALLSSTRPLSGQDARTAPPMTSESTLEAEVFTQMVQDGDSPESVDTVDLRMRLTALRARADRVEVPTEPLTVAGLATAVRAAQAERLRTYAELDVNLRQEMLSNASQDAVAALDLALDSGTPSAVDATAAFFAARDAALPQLDPLVAQRAERNASVTFRMLANSYCVGELCTRDGSVQEAYEIGRAVRVILQNANASQAVRDRADAAARALFNRITTSPEQDLEAWADYRARMVEDTDSVLQQLLGTSGSAVEPVKAAAQVGRDSGNQLRDDLALFLRIGGERSPEQVSQAVAKAFAHHSERLGFRAGPIFGAFGDKGDDALLLLIITQESSRP